MIKKLWIFPTFLSLYFLPFWSISIGQAKTKPAKSGQEGLISPLKVKLTVKQAISLGLKFSFEVKDQKNGDQVRELEYKSKKRSLSLPQIKLYAHDGYSISIVQLYAFLFYLVMKQNQQV